MIKSIRKNKIFALSLIAAFVLMLFSGVFMSESKKAYAAEDSGVSDIYELGNASTYSFKALSGASIDYSTLDDDNARTVGITYGATVALSESYDIIKVEAYLVSKNRNITLENAKYGIKPYKIESSDIDSIRTYNAFFYIAEENYAVEYRCIWVLYVAGDTKSVICLADYTNVSTDYSVKGLANYDLNDTTKTISDHYYTKLKDLVDGINRSDQIKSDVENTKEIISALFGDGTLKKAVAIIGVLILSFFVLSFVTAFVGRRR